MARGLRTCYCDCMYMDYVACRSIGCTCIIQKFPGVVHEPVHYSTHRQVAEHMIQRTLDMVQGFCRS